MSKVSVSTREWTGRQNCFHVAPSDENPQTVLGEM